MVLAASWVAPALAAPPPLLRDTPCRGCLVAPPPDAAGRRPLLVVLHGDDGSAQAAITPWRKAAHDQRVVLFAPLCPRELGCAGSYWRWDGPVSWLTQQLDALDATVPFDRAHVVLAGWSGGASWMGLKGGELSSTFSGLAFEGGGLPPRSSACPACVPPVHYLAGERNPLHHLEVATRDWLAGCGARVVWEPLPGRDHAGEAAALASPGTTSRILELLLATPGPCVAGVTSSSAASGAPSPSAASSAVPSSPGAPAEVAEVRAPPETAPPPVAGRCGCDVVRSHDVRALGALALAAVWAAWRRRGVLRSKP